MLVTFSDFSITFILRPLIPKFPQKAPSGMLNFATVRELDQPLMQARVSTVRELKKIYKRFITLEI